MGRREPVCGPGATGSRPGMQSDCLDTLIVVAVTGSGAMEQSDNDRQMDHCHKGETHQEVSHILSLGDNGLPQPGISAIGDNNPTLAPQRTGRNSSRVGGIWPLGNRGIIPGAPRITAGVLHARAGMAAPCSTVSGCTREKARKFSPCDGAAIPVVLTGPKPQAGRNARSGVRRAESRSDIQGTILWRGQAAPRQAF